MAERHHLKCPACGSRRLLEAFGIGKYGEYKAFYAPGYESNYSIQTIGGRGRCAWEHYSLPIEFAQALRTRLKSALDQIDQEIFEATGEEPPDST